MQIKAVKQLIDNFDMDELKKLEERLLEEETIGTDIVPGVDEGEQLTHLSGAMWCIQEAEKNGTKPQSEVRNFASRIRNSIS